MQLSNMDGQSLNQSQGGSSAGITRLSPMSSDINLCEYRDDARLQTGTVIEHNMLNIVQIAKMTLR